MVGTFSSRYCCRRGRKSDIFHNAYGYGLFTGGIGLHYGAETLGAAVVPISGGNTERQITLLEDFKPRGIAGTPSYILTIAEKMEEMGSIQQRMGLSTGYLVQNLGQRKYAMQ